MNVIFMGTPEFAIPSLLALITSRHNVVAIITQEDKPAGRGQKITSPPVKEIAEKNNIPVFQPHSIRNENFYNTIREFNPDVIAVAAYGKILPSEVLEIPRYGCINLHSSLLPKYRGAAPVHWALINGEFKTGITIMKMDVGMDTGDIIYQEELDILDDDDVVSLSNALSVIGASCLVNILNELEETGTLKLQKQGDLEVTFAPLLKKEDGKIDWSKHVDNIYNLIRGVNPHPGAFSTINSKYVKILKAFTYDYDIQAAPTMSKGGKRAGFEIERVPGEIIAIVKGKGIVVRAGVGALLISEIQPENKAPMSAESFINGGYAKIGSIFK